MAARIFISYRRENASGDAGRLADLLSQRFGRDRVFLDVDTIDPGADFVNVLHTSLRETAAVLVVMRCARRESSSTGARLRRCGPRITLRWDLPRRDRRVLLDALPPDDHISTLHWAFSDYAAGDESRRRTMRYYVALLNARAGRTVEAAAELRTLERELIAGATAGSLLDAVREASRVDGR